MHPKNFTALYSFVFGFLLVRCWCMSIITQPLEDMTPEDVTADPTAMSKAILHMQMMNRRRCGAPVPKLFVVQDLYPNASRRYRPHCVVLHRCDNDAGCCQSDEMRCDPTGSETVHLHFNVVEHTASGRIRKVMRVPFLNHTSCECTGTSPTPR